MGGGGFLLHTLRKSCGCSGSGCVRLCSPMGALCFPEVSWDRDRPACQLGGHCESRGKGSGRIALPPQVWSMLRELPGASRQGGPSCTPPALLTCVSGRLRQSLAVPAEQWLCARVGCKLSLHHLLPTPALLSRSCWGAAQCTSPQVAWPGDTPRGLPHSLPNRDRGVAPSSGKEFQ